MSTTWSVYQQRVFEFVERETGSAIVEAVAGSGKTTTIVEACKRIGGTVYLAAFNKRMGEELKARIGGLQWKYAGTFHSVGFRALTGSVPRGSLRVESRKVQEIWERHCENKRWSEGLAQTSVLGRLVSVAKARLVGVVGLAENPDPWRSIIEHHGLLEDAPEGVKEEELIERGQWLLEQSNALEDVVDFDDMLYLPLLRRLRLTKYDVVFIDEAQDTNPARLMTAQGMLKAGGRVIAVGDPCQPQGTLVAVVAKQARGTTKAQITWVPIEQLQEGAQVLSYHPADSAFVYGRRVLGKSVRPFRGNLVTASGGGSSSRYTPNHHCFANFKPLENHYAVYIMRRGGCFRVGLSRMGHAGMIGPQMRLRAEGGSALWILATFASRGQALLYEAHVASYYGLPMVMFTAKNNSVQTQEELDGFWAGLERELGGVMVTRAKQALQEHYREFEFPMFNGRAYTTMLRRPTIVRACNLLSGCAMLPFRGECHVKSENWISVEIGHEYYQGPVYSLTVEGEHLYVADGLVTHNCQAIYGFSSASAAALDEIEAQFKAVRLPLSVCYRCAQRVVQHAQQWAPQIEAFAGAVEGRVEQGGQLSELLWKWKPKPGDALLCRFNRPLVRIAFALIKRGVPARIEGREIGEGLIALTKKWPVQGLDDLVERVEHWEDRERAKALARKQVAKAQAVSDKVGALMALIERARELRVGVEGLRELIREMFQDSAQADRRIFTLSSIHKAKGLEWDRVFLLGRGEVLPSPYATQAWELEQERNLCYVAVTRAKRELVELQGVEQELASKQPEEVARG